MSTSDISYSSTRYLAFWTGVVFLVGYWLIGYDGITFSDDVYYLLAGKSFWEGTMEVNAYHFSTRWGAYVPSGLFGSLLGFEPHRISLVSLLSYAGTLWLLIKILPDKVNPWLLVIWSCTQVYFLHFLTKVYPDSLLVFWTILIPFSATFRSKRPVLSALGVISGLFFGFITKETIVFMALLPVLLFAWDWKKAKSNLPFYAWLVGFGLVVGSLYLGYFWFQFGSPFYRFESIQDGHYISEFTYADKSTWVMIRRLSILPILTFVERSYWLWFVFAIPGLYKLWKNPQSPGLEFGLAFLSLLICFWFMSTSFRFYNPIYLNPRHLIILVPILGFLIALGWEEWQENLKLKRIITGLILLGVVISLIQQDWKMAGFQFMGIGILYTLKDKKLTWAFGIYLLIPAVFSISYQRNLKEYPSMLQTLRMEASNSENQSPILTNNFLDFSKKVLLPDSPDSQILLVPIEKLDSIKSHPPQEIRVLLYDYYRHAYPKEQVDVTALEKWLEMEYAPVSETRKDLVWIRTFRRNDPQ
ncbi:hypothetical protein D0X99_08965 [Algoriphagus lacus]|uniref:Glycosyltransferase RgtA/B/C/D-like domain-containing protein n=1 Tax=Algoriphagus lacus TaxID=2056311 RepID=A0A418PRQ2_9BACT|nr:hypothetical protein [Algoriphagus lacus]RIW15551.1 hypothetical protein D0X99_08965 [Algoriphagus lacus]